MSTSTDDRENTLEGKPPYPTYEFVKKNELWTVGRPQNTRHLVWTLVGPLETAVRVKAGTPTDPKATVPLYDVATGEWHPIASKSVCVPRVRSLVVHIDILSDWEDTWEELHYEHSEKEQPVPFCNAAWGLLEGHGSRIQLLRCCDSERPRGKDATIAVRPTKVSSEDDDGEFVTVRDYVTTVHPWMIGLRGEIMEVMTEFEELYNPLPEEEYPLIVDAFPLDCIGVRQGEQNEAQELEDDEDMNTHPWPSASL